MAQRTAIEWADMTWNPVTGCTKVGAGCENCYAERFAERWRGVPGHPYEQGFDLRLWPERLNRPATWKKPRMVFVNSMSDLFQKEIKRGFVDAVFDMMETAHWHIYQVLTKRSSRMRDYVRDRYGGGRIPAHIWPGVSVEDAAQSGRIHHLKAINSVARFISFEPLLAPVGPVDLTGVAWAIVGGESGPNARPMHPQWARDLRNRCKAAGTAFFFKRHGRWLHESQDPNAVRDWDAADERGSLHCWEIDNPFTFSIPLKKSDAGRLLDGVEHNGFPAALMGGKG